VPVTSVSYTVDGWGVGELWYEGTRLVWHELPHPRVPAPGDRRARVRIGNGYSPKTDQLLHRLESYFGGSRVSFEDVEIDLDGWTPFQLDIVRALRRVPFGDVVSYAELARLAGHPRAHRAAGTFCARNRFPLVVPCHRVVSSDGVGSYGSLGLEYKRRLLALEGVSL
jgi:methylated-DNA-[protein]-cysteine S-methyltransferase